MMSADNDKISIEEIHKEIDLIRKRKIIRRIVLP